MAALPTATNVLAADIACGDRAGTVYLTLP
jgi:hypothetical protein